jgi:hypothetical protein
MVNSRKPRLSRGVLLPFVHRQAPNQGGKCGVGRLVCSSAPNTLPVFGLTMWTCKLSR